MPKKSTPEGLVLRAICDYLKLLEHQGKLLFWRQNNTPTFDQARGIYRKATGPGHRPGVPDLIAVLKPSGRAMFIEVKAHKGVVSPDQKMLLNALGEAGALCVVARSIDDVAAVLKKP